jgi:hypothetical protein
MAVAASCLVVVQAAPIAAVRVIKAGVPVAGTVALSAVGAKSGMTGWRVMAGGTSCGKARILAGGMTIAAGQARMSICQWESTVVKRGRQPGAGCMARPAVGAELSVVMIVLCMTGIAIGWRALVNIVDMSTGAIYLNVRAGQFESR